MAFHSDSRPAAGSSTASTDSSSGPNVREVQRIFLHYYLELLNDQTVMQQLPPGFRLEMQNAHSETSRFLITDRITQDYISGPDSLQKALRDFELRHRFTVVEAPQTSSEIRLFDDDMPPVDPRFVGRQGPLQQIADALLAPDPRSVIIRGMPGIGKSALARKAVADPRIEDAYNIAWIACEGIETVEQLEQCLAKAPQLVSHLRHAMTQGASPHARITQAADPTSADQPKRLLIVLNRIDQLVATYHRRDAPLLSLINRLEQRRVASLRPRLLITLTSDHDLGIDSVDIDVEPLRDDDAATFFVKFKCTQRWRESPELRSFVRRFDGHPLALSIAARAAPKDGDLATYAELLQQPQHADDDELDTAIRMLLLDSSLEHPKTRQLLRLVAYWPTWSCDVDVIYAILGLPDGPAVMKVADPASKLNLVRFESRDDWRPPLRCYTMMQPLKDRLRRIDPPLDMELASIRAFLFARVFREEACSHLVPYPLFGFQHFDAVFIDAFRSDDHGVITSALDAVLLIPRTFTYLRSFSSFVYDIGYVHPLHGSTLKEACAAADRIGDAARYRSLRLVVAESEASDFGYPEGPSLEGIQADSRELAEAATQASDQRGLRKHCYLLAWCELVDASSAVDEQRDLRLFQARQYLSMVDHQGDSRCFDCPCSDYFPTASRENTLDTIQIHLLRFHVVMATQAVDDTYDIYLRILAILDEGCITPSERASVELHVRLHTAAAFALHDAPQYAGKVIDLSARTFPSTLNQEHYCRPFSPSHDLLFAPILFRQYLVDHKDASYWRMQLVDSIGFLCAGTLGVAGLHGHAESALLWLEASGDAKRLHSAWLSVLLWWSLLLNADEQAEIDISLTFDDMVVFKDRLALPHDRHAPSYHHGYAALLALCDGKLVEAARQFTILESICLNDIPYPTIDPKVVRIPYDWRPLHCFPPDVVKSVWPYIFGGLARDCLGRQAVAQSQILAADLSDSHPISDRRMLSLSSADGPDRTGRRD